MKRLWIVGAVVLALVYAGSRGRCVRGAGLARRRRGRLHQQPAVHHHPEPGRRSRPSRGWSSSTPGADLGLLRRRLLLDAHGAGRLRRPRGETIELALLKKPAADPAALIGSLVVNPGGPGAPAPTTPRAPRTSSGSRSSTPTTSSVRPRGTGHSAPVDCLSDAELDAYVAEDPDPDTDAEVSDYMRSVEALGRGCAERSATSPPTSPPWRRRATWTCCALPSASRSWTTSARPTAPSSGRRTPTSSPNASAGWSRRGRRPLDQLAAAGPAAGRRVRDRVARLYVADCVAQGDCVLGDSVEEGSRPSRACSTRSTRTRCRPAAAATSRSATRSTASCCRSTTATTGPYLTQGLEAASTVTARCCPLSPTSTTRGVRAAATPTTAPRPTTRSTASTTLVDPADEVPAQLPAFEKASPRSARSSPGA